MLFVKFLKEQIFKLARFTKKCNIQKKKKNFISEQIIIWVYECNFTEFKGKLPPRSTTRSRTVPAFIIVVILFST